MKITLLMLATILGSIGCNPPAHETAKSSGQAEIHLVEERLDAIHMGDRIDEHYSGGDIGTYFSQFAWSDAAIVLAWDQFTPFVEFFDAVRAAAQSKVLTAHSPINNREIAMIFQEAFPAEDVFGEGQFGDMEVTPLPVDKFYQILEMYRSRVSSNPKGEQ